jgi:hypothetical protein
MMHCKDIISHIDEFYNSLLYNMVEKKKNAWAMNSTLFIVKIESAYIVRDSLVQFNRKLIKTCPAGNVTMNVITIIQNGWFDYSIIFN